jgi:hypothetical protein
MLNLSTLPVGVEPQTKTSQPAFPNDQAILRTLESSATPLSTMCSAFGADFIS